MKISLVPGKYVAAVSGGVDSVVLLDILQRDKNFDLAVAHFDHGIRPDSAEDAAFVGNLAKQYALPFFTHRVELGPRASEALSRKYRYEFLHKVRKNIGADAIVTAHHQDDVVETALLNVLRGTKRRGFISLKDTRHIKRPLLHVTKDELKDYAVRQGLEWREDSTNQDERYKRNQIRALIKNSLTPESRHKLIGLLDQIHDYDEEIEIIVNDYLSAQNVNELNRRELNTMERPEASELVAGWLRRNQAGFDKSAIERVVEGSRTLSTGAQIDLQGNYYCELGRDEIILKSR